MESFLSTFSLEELAKANQYTIIAFAAIGTFLGVGVSLWYYIADMRTKAEAIIRSQAELITAWIIDDYASQNGKMLLDLSLLNSSKQVVYNVIAIVVDNKQRFRVGNDIPFEYGYFELFSHLPPGILETKVKFGGHGMCRRFGIEIAFRDSAGRNWVRHGDGVLEQIEQSPAQYYGISEPAGWKQPKQFVRTDHTSQLA